MIRKVAIAGYRSLRDVRLALDTLNVVTGANGSGKSSLYRALRLLADVAQGRIIQSLAAEGGLSFTLWAGPESFARSVKRGQHPVQGTVRNATISLKLGFAADDYGYAIDLGLPQPGGSAFARDPEIKVESQWTGAILGRSNVFAARNGPSVRIRGDSGEWRYVFQHLAPFDSMMTHCSDPLEALELLVLRERMRDWRFYDHFRTDREAPARRPQVGTYTPVLASDGADLAAALQTIREIGDVAALEHRDRECGRLLRIGDAAARPAASLEGGRAFRRHAALSAVDRGAAVAAPAQPDGSQRARDQPASRPAAVPGAAHRTSRQTIADRRRLPRSGAGIRARGRSRGAADRAGEAVGRDAGRRRRAAGLDLADAVKHGLNSLSWRGGPLC
jgi:energy-coupling factor transporter ATP-binding protein EcfA2